MGTKWNLEHSDIETESTPKLSLVGRIEMTVNGRPVTAIANEDQILIQSRSLFSSFRIWSDSKFVLEAVRTGLEITGIRLVVSFGWFGNVEIFPRTSKWLRFLT